MAMRLAKGNIQFVRRLEKDGITYEWFVVMKSGRVSDTRCYVNYVNGRTVVKEYPINLLPKAVRDFVKGKTETVTYETEDGFRQYIIQ